MSKKLHLAGYLNPSPTLHSDASWKHPRASQKYPDPKIYQDVARTLERGFFDFVFFADVLSAPLRYGDSIKPAVEKGVQFVASLDPSYIALTMANVTRHLGLGVTRTTTYGHPFDLARSFATLDHLTEGRIAWNVVTSVSNSEAQNYGVERLLDHSVRYERAHEFLEAAFKLWSSWEPDAL
ncbi:LLM class flavin-dependent oxidoreductase, partial [Paracoccus sp. PXZ]